MDYQQALMEEGARTMERLRLERDEWKKRYHELSRAYIQLAKGVIRERGIEEIPVHSDGGKR